VVVALADEELYRFAATRCRCVALYWLRRLSMALEVEVQRRLFTVPDAVVRLPDDAT
jgi:hypothetical protein